MGQAKRRREAGGSDQPPLDLLDDLLMKGERHVRKMLLEQRKKELQSFYHLVSPSPSEPDAIMPVSWANPVEKQLALISVRAQSRKMGAVAAMFIGEGWSVQKLDHPSPWHAQRWLATVGPPSQSPDRVEVIEIMTTDGVENRSTLLQMVRDKPGGSIIALLPFGRPNMGMIGPLIDGIIQPKAEKHDPA